MASRGSVWIRTVGVDQMQVRDYFLSNVMWCFICTALILYLFFIRHPVPLLSLEDDTLSWLFIGNHIVLSLGGRQWWWPMVAMIVNVKPWDVVNAGKSIRPSGAHVNEEGYSLLHTPCLGEFTQGTSPGKATQVNITHQHLLHINSCFWINRYNVGNWCFTPHSLNTSARSKMFTTTRQNEVQLALQSSDSSLLRLRLKLFPPVPIG